MNDSVDLTNCDREPIHIPGSIQPYGSLIECDADIRVVRRHSLNTREMLGLETGDINGRELELLIGPKAVHDIRNAMARSNEPSHPGLIFGLRLPAGEFDVTVHRYKAQTIIECEPVVSNAKLGSPLDLTRSLIARLGQIEHVDVLVGNSARLLRAALGYDRVMIYRFAADGSGKVISEAKRSDLESFRGQHFPAGDIPQQARRLYLQNTIRIVSDSSGAGVAVEPVLDASGEPLDLSFAHLRSVSPIHCEYLRNMGVGASMSISIIVGGQLWGLIACHHYAPRRLSMTERIAAEMFGQFFSLQLEALTNRLELATAEEARRRLDNVIKTFTYQSDVAEMLRSNLGEFAKLMPCDGVGIWMSGSWSGHGATPPARSVPALIRFLGNASGGKVWATHTLSDGLPEAESYAAAVAGVLSVPLSATARDYLLFFRKEVVQTLEWAGDPNKRYATGQNGDRLTPRTSFAIWKQMVERQSEPWTPADRDMAEATRISLVEIVLRHNEILADERNRSELRQKVLDEELNHRVKNILALIKSLVSFPLDVSQPIQAYVDSLRGRIQALALAHDQVIRGDGGGALDDLLKAELSPYREAAAVSLDGPPAWLEARAFSVMALILHEMATNAAKYGGLSRESGRLEVVWKRLPDGACEINWTESGGPPVSPPKRQGFGSVLIGRSVSFDLGGESVVDYPASGVKARFVLPAKFVSWSAKAAQPVLAASEDKPDVTATLAGKKVLLVEDQLLIAMNAEDMLQDEGAALVETASSAAEALRKLANFQPDVAVLDINLGPDTTSMPVAEELLKRNLPFIFATGYGDTAMIPAGLKSVPAIRKPYEQAALVDAINRALTAQQE